MDFLLNGGILQSYTGDSPEHPVAEIPWGVRTIAARAFENCVHLKEVFIPATVKFIESRAFAGCTALEKIDIPRTADSVGMYVFSDCIRLREARLGRMLFLEEGMFFQCRALEKIIFPESLKIIRSRAFQGCTSLKQAVILEGVQEIESRVFQDCTSLEKVILPESIRKIGNSNFPDTLHQLHYCFHGNCYVSELMGYFSIIETIATLHGIFYHPSLRNGAMHPLLFQKLHFHEDEETIIPLLRQNSCTAFEVLLKENNPDRISEIAGILLTPETIDAMILDAIEKKSYAVQSFLTDYKYRHFTFRPPDFHL